MSFVRSNNPRRAGSFELNALQSPHCDHGCSYLHLVPGRCVEAGWAWRPPLQGHGHAIPRAHGERGFALLRTMAPWWSKPARTTTPAMTIKREHEASFPTWPGAVRHKQPPFLTLWAPRQTAEVGWTPWSGCGLLWWVVSNRKFFWHQKWVLLCAAILCAPARSKIIEDYASMQTSYGCIFLK